MPSKEIDEIIEKIDQVKADLLRLKEKLSGETFLDFESVWKLYPKKDAKKAAFKAFKSNITTSDYDYFLKSVERFAWFWDQQPKERLQFCPGMAPWINQEKWKSWIADVPEWEKSKIPQRRYEPASREPEIKDAIPHSEAVKIISGVLKNIG